jgi:hypothetical protein
MTCLNKAAPWPPLDLDLTTQCSVTLTSTTSCFWWPTRVKREAGISRWTLYDLSPGTFNK